MLLENPQAKHGDLLVNDKSMYLKTFPDHNEDNALPTDISLYLDGLMGNFGGVKFLFDGEEEIYFSRKEMIDILKKLKGDTTC